MNVVHAKQDGRFDAVGGGKGLSNVINYTLPICGIFQQLGHFSSST